MNAKGFNVYRRRSDEGWVKLNDSPVTRLSDLSSEVARQDSETSFFAELVNNSPEDLEQDFVRLNLLLKTFESNELARFLGIYFRDTSCIAGQSYQYRVTKLSGGVEQELGVSAQAVAGGASAADAVEGFEVYQEGKELAFNWQQDETRFYAVNIISEDEAGSRIRLNEQPIMLSMVTDSAGATAYPRPMFKKKGFREEELYSFYIEGIDYFGAPTALSAPITLVFDDTTPPPPPQKLTAETDSMLVSLAWDFTSVPDLKAFAIYRSRKSDGPFEKIATTEIEKAGGQYEEKLTAPGPYYYKVDAMDHAGNASSSEMAFVDVQDVFPPGMPTGLLIKSDTGRFFLRWTMGTEPDLWGYYVFRAVDGQNEDHYVLLNATPIDTCFYEQLLPKNVKNKFQYYVVAVDTSFNRSPASALSTASLPDVVAPEAPSIKEIRYTSVGIVLEWALLTENDLAGYHVYRSDTSSSAVPEQVNASALPPGSFRFTDRSARPGNAYGYQVQAFDSTGNISPFSRSVFALWYQPSEITSELKVSIKSQKRGKTNRLEWVGLPDGSVRGYMVFRGATVRAMKPLSPLIAEGNTYADRALAQKGYVYQVRAYTTGGETIYSPLIEWKQR